MRYILVLASVYCFVQWWDPSWSRSEFLAKAPPNKLGPISQTQKHLIFKVGPPASGKTDALETALRELGLSQQPYMEINIDKYVEEKPGYKAQVNLSKRILNEHASKTVRSPVSFISTAKTCVPIIPVPLMERVCNLDKEAYFKARPEADKEAYAALFLEFLDLPHYRNIVYESTGSAGSYEWILKLARLARLHGYKVHIVYPFVRWDSLLERSELRAISIGRLICPQRIRTIRKESRRNLHEIIRRLDRPDFPIDSVLIINNDGPKRRMKKICHFHKTIGRSR